MNLPRPDCSAVEGHVVSLTLFLPFFLCSSSRWSSFTMENEWLTSVAYQMCFSAPQGDPSEKRGHPATPSSSFVLAEEKTATLWEHLCGEPDKQSYTNPTQETHSIYIMLFDISHFSIPNTHCHLKRPDGPDITYAKREIKQEVSQ